MNLTFGMPEILVLSGVYLFPEHVALSLTFLCMGIISRICAYSMDRAEQDPSFDVQVVKKEIL